MAPNPGRKPRWKPPPRKPPPAKPPRKPPPPKPPPRKPPPPKPPPWKPPPPKPPRADASGAVAKPTAAIVTAVSSASTVFRNMTILRKGYRPEDYDSFCGHLLHLQRKLMARRQIIFLLFRSASGE